jgi:hypothetical protein
MVVFLIGSQVCNLYANLCICCATQVVYLTAQNSGTEAHSAEKHASANSTGKPVVTGLILNLGGDVRVKENVDLRIERSSRALSALVALVH